MAEKLSLRYIDETDRSYGIAGMTIALALWDGEPYLASISIDRPVGESLKFTPAFGYSRNPRLMASLAWREHLKMFELTAAMIMGNAMCRAYVGDSTSLNTRTADDLRAVIREEGLEACALDSDETDLIFNKTQRYLGRVFTHSGVSALARSLATELRNRRNLSASEVFDILEALNNM